VFKNGVLEYNPNPSAVEFHEAPEEVKVLWGPMGSGKTSACLVEFAMLASECEVPLRGIVIRSSHPELRDSTLKTWEEWFGELVSFKARDAKAILPLPHPKTGEVLEHELHFRSCQRVEDASKLLSTEYGFAFLEECVPAYQSSGVLGSGLPYGLFEMVTLRLRQKGVTRRTICVTFNPPFPNHWCYSEFLQAARETLAEKNYFVKKQPPLENEKNLPKGYYDRFDRLDPDTVRRFKYGEVVQAYSGVRVFPEARDGIHVVDHDLRPIKGVPLVLGFDFGRTQATIVTQITPVGQWRWVGELQTEGMGTGRHVELLRAYLNQRFADFEIGNCWGDPAGAYGDQATEETSFKVLRDNGFNIVAGARDLPARLEPIKDILLKTTPEGDPMLVISRSGCPMAAEGMIGGYRFPKSRDGVVGDKPMKNLHSHLADAAQAIASMEFAVTANARAARDQWGRPLPEGRRWNPLERPRMEPRVSTAL
jgi:hypothetical protein